MSKIDDMKQEATRLVALLNDPEAGLFTWYEALNRVMCRLRDLYFAAETEESKKSATLQVEEAMTRWYPPRPSPPLGRAQCTVLFRFFD